MTGKLQIVSFHDLSVAVQKMVQGPIFFSLVVIEVTTFSTKRTQCQDEEGIPIYESGKGDCDVIVPEAFIVEVESDFPIDFIVDLLDDDMISGCLRYSDGTKVHVLQVSTLQFLKEFKLSLRLRVRLIGTIRGQAVTTVGHSENEIKQIYL
jgi:hypothetical protein